MSLIVGKIIFAVESHCEHKSTASGIIPVFEEARIRAIIDRRFGDIDMLHPTVYLVDNKLEVLPMINEKSKKYIKELLIANLLKEVEFGCTRFMNSTKQMLRGILRELHDNNNDKIHVLWSEELNSEDENKPERLSFDEFMSTFVSPANDYVGSDKWFAKMYNHGISRYDIKCISNHLCNGTDEKFVYEEYYMQAL